MVPTQLPRDDTDSLSPPLPSLLFFFSGLNDPAPTAVKDTSENNQWSMFEVQRRVSGEGEGGTVLVRGLVTSSGTLEKGVITYLGRGAAVPEWKSGLALRSGTAASEQRTYP